MTSGRSSSSVPFLPEKRIEREADLLLAEYGRDHAVISEPPVPIDELLELQLGLTVEIDDLCSAFGNNDVLGAIWFNRQLVRVDRSLDPHENPKLLGRFRFTLAHEAAHWRLHRAHFREDPEQAHLFGGRGSPAILCRSSQRPPEEWQADCFASFLLMPRPLVISSWQNWHGSLDPVSLDDLGSHTGNAAPVARLEAFCRPFAARFEVSAQAMRIRLEGLGLLCEDRPSSLF